ncbi:endo alpha-1,4 polygalactosaminidase [Catellatospora vulcania]|uniref:endo alpha-1,4 polygalactosaminidase n=1 Tax=Catellatospora vulcania TaxID=1460450 RepID=UPI0018B01452|nr:endo alpha-1,4 polygalactosaminidase [Catellatospora vulcania]
MRVAGVRVPVSALVVLGCVACATPARPSHWYDAPPPAAVPELLRWQWALAEPPEASAADVFVLDGFTTAASTVEDLHRARRRAVCYLPLASVERDSPDAARFPAELTDEAGRVRWDAPEDELRTRIAPILTDRLRLCRDKGFDAAALDQLAGAPRSVVDQLVTQAHRMSLPVGLLDAVHAHADLTVPDSPDRPPG